MTVHLPAYAKELADRRRRGFTLASPLVTVTLHWRRRPTIGYGVVVPTGAEPHELAWGWVRGLEVIVFVRGDRPDRVSAAASAIASAAPRRLLIVDADKLCLTSVVSPRTEGRHAA
jgi:hypothetical protein